MHLSSWNIRVPLGTYGFPGCFRTRGFSAGPGCVWVRPAKLGVNSTGAIKVLVAQSCPTLCDPMDCHPPGSSVHGILQARILEWVAISSPGDLPSPEIEPRSSALAGEFFTTEPQGKPQFGSLPPVIFNLTYASQLFFLSLAIHTW